MERTTEIAKQTVPKFVVQMPEDDFDSLSKFPAFLDL